MRKAVALIAVVVLAGLGVLVALGPASAGGSKAGGETAGPSASSGTTVSNSVSSSVVVSNSTSCSVSVTSVNGVTTTTKSGDCSGSTACSVSVTSVNGVTTTTKAGDCANTSITTPVRPPDLSFLRQLISSLLVWFRFAAGM